jgi:hypothetical protein
MNFRATRRRFLVGLGSVVGAVAARSTLLGGLLSPDTGRAATGQESFGNFILLAEGATIPTSSRMSGATPNFDGVNAGGTSAALVAEYKSASDLTRGVGLPMYELATLPSWLQPGPINAVHNSQGQLYSATIGYDVTVQGETFTGVDLTASELYLQPLPLWPTRVRDVSYPVAKVDYLPTAGVHQMSGEGHVLYWFERGILYRLRAEYQGDEASVRELAAQLRRVA